MIDIQEGNLKNGVLGLVLAVVEVIQDALEHQAGRRIESGSLSEEEVERLGAALADLDLAIEDIKREQGLAQAVQSVRDGLDDVVNDVVQTALGVIDPRKWPKRQMSNVESRMSNEEGEEALGVRHQALETGHPSSSIRHSASQGHEALE